MKQENLLPSSTVSEKAKAIAQNPHRRRRCSPICPSACDLSPISAVIGDVGDALVCCVVTRICCRFGLFDCYLQRTQENCGLIRSPRPSFIKRTQDMRHRDSSMCVCWMHACTQSTTAQTLLNWRRLWEPCGLLTIRRIIMKDFSMVRAWLLFDS